MSDDMHCVLVSGSAGSDMYKLNVRSLSSVAKVEGHVALFS